MDPDPDEHVHPGQESLEWGPGVNEELRGTTPTARYSRMSEQARRMMNEESMCAMFCGGKKCKYCTHDNWTKEQMAINGLYSAWVTDNILAMARPSNYAFDNFGVLSQFEEKGIRTVINLQQPGEHASCGYGNDSSGFSYNPQRLMEKNIYFYNFAWQDYGIAPMSTLLDIVKVMQFALAEGKVAIHCHAGLGRTGLLIACYLVYNNRMKAGDAIHYVRSRRPGAIQTSQQVQTVIDFETHLKPFRTIFPSRVPNASEISFKHFLNRQSHMLHGFEGRRLRYIPKVLYISCERLLELAGKGEALKKVRSSPSTPLKNPEVSNLTSGLSQIKVRSEHNLFNVVNASKERSKSFEDLTNNSFKKMLSDNQTDNSSTDASVLFDMESGSEGGKDGKNSPEMSDSKSGQVPKQGLFENQASVGSEETSSTTSKKMSGTSEFGQAAGNNNAQSDCNLKSPGSEEEDDDDCIVFGKPDTIIPTLEVETCVDRGVNVNSPYIGDHRGQVLPPGARSPSPNCTNQTSCTAPSTRARSRETSPSGKLTDNPSSSGYVSTDSNSPNQTTKKLKKKPIRERLKNRFGCLEATESEKDLAEKCAKETRQCTHVCEALASTEYSKEARSRADQIETRLNETEDAWTSIANENDPYVLSAIIYDWLDQLKEPVLRRQDLTHLLEKSDTPVEVLKHLEKPIKYFIEYLALVISRLFPQAKDLEMRVVERILSHLTHQVVRTDVTSSTVNLYQPVHWGEMKSSDCTRLVKFFYSLMRQLEGASKTKKVDR